MNEDDTFIRLSRPSFQEMRQLHLEYQRKSQYHMPHEEIVDFFKKHNWDVNEFAHLLTSTFT